MYIEYKLSYQKMRASLRSRRLRDLTIYNVLFFLSKGFFPAKNLSGRLKIIWSGLGRRNGFR
jgi:hypothetical protein